jgi:hypothetical protein
MSAELREKLAALGIARHDGTFAFNLSELITFIESTRDTALAVRTEAIASEFDSYYTYRDENGDTGVAETIRKKFSTSAEQAALEAIKQEVRQAALRDFDKLLNDAGDQEMAESITGGHEPDEAELVEEGYHDGVVCTLNYLWKRLALLDNPSPFLEIREMTQPERDNLQHYYQERRKRRDNPSPEANWPQSVPPGEQPNYSAPVLDGDFLVYAGFRWNRILPPSTPKTSPEEPKR